MSNQLKLSKVSSFYGPSQILQELDLIVEQGQVVCLLGLNGMGKTTTLRTIMGLVDRIEGDISLNGKPLVGRTYQRAAMGVTIVPEDRKVFSNLTVEENMSVAIQGSDKKDDFNLQDVLKLFPKLSDRMSQKAGTLSGGEQQMLVVSRALLANPYYMMLDEPTEGLAPEYVDAIKDSILAARERNIGVILVEQSLALALAVGDVFYVIENGQIVFHQDRASVLADTDQIEQILTVK